MKHLWLFIPIVISLTLVSCSNSPHAKPTGALHPDTLVSILVDIHLVDAILHEENNNPEEKRDKALYFYPSLLEKHQVSRAEIDSSIVYYTRFPKEFSRMYEKVIKELNRRLDSIEKEAFEH